MWYWKVLEMQPPAKETQCTICCTRKDEFSPGIPAQWTWFWAFWSLEPRKNALLMF